MAQKQNPDFWHSFSARHLFDTPKKKGVYRLSCIATEVSLNSFIDKGYLFEGETKILKHFLTTKNLRDLDIDGEMSLCLLRIYPIEVQICLQSRNQNKRSFPARDCQGQGIFRIASRENTVQQQYLLIKSLAFVIVPLKSHCIVHQRYLCGLKCLHLCFLI